MKENFNWTVSAKSLSHIKSDWRAEEEFDYFEINRVDVFS